MKKPCVQRHSLVIWTDWYFPLSNSDVIATLDPSPKSCMRPHCIFLSHVVRCADGVALIESKPVMDAGWEGEIRSAGMRGARRAGFARHAPFPSTCAEIFA